MLVVLTPTSVRSIRIEAQARKNRDNNIIVTGLITEDDCIAVYDIAKEIGVTLTDTSFRIRRFSKDNKHVEVRFTEKKLTFQVLKTAENYEQARHSQRFS